MTIRTMLVDDHAVIRDGLRLVLHAQDDIEVVGDAADGSRAVELAIALRPDVVIMDLHLPGMDGVETTRQILRATPDARVLVLSMYDTSEHIRTALRAGALGYLQKESAGDEVVKGVREVNAGRRFFGQRITQHLIADLDDVVVPPLPGTRDTLSERELTVARNFAAGRTSAEVAAMLEVSTRSVDIIRARVMQKLGLMDDADLRQLDGML